MTNNIKFVITKVVFFKLKMHRNLFSGEKGYPYPFPLNLALGSQASLNTKSWLRQCSDHSNMGRCWRGFLPFSLLSINPPPPPRPPPSACQSLFIIFAPCQPAQRLSWVGGGEEEAEEGHQSTRVVLCCSDYNNFI